MLKKIIALSALVALGLPAYASNYFVVVPLKGKAAAGSITVALNPASLPSGEVGVGYVYSLADSVMVSGDPAFNGSGVSWSVVGGALPAGLSLDANSGLISGTPSAAASSTVTIQAAYRGANGSQQYQVQVVQIVVSLAGDGTAVTTGMVGKPYSFDFKTKLSVSGGAATPDAVAFTAGSALPGGLVLSSAGILSGTPTTEVTDSQVAVIASYRGASVTSRYLVTVGPDEFRFNPVLSGNTVNYVITDAARAAGWDGVQKLKATLTIPPGAVVGSTGTGAYALDTGSGYPAGSVVVVKNAGYIVGAGGQGGQATGWNSAGGNGLPGGPALRVQYAGTTIQNDGVIGGGGGGGGGANQASPYGSFGIGAGGSGGGAGYYVGTTGGASSTSTNGDIAQNGAPGQSGTLTAGGQPGNPGMYRNAMEGTPLMVGNRGGAGGGLGATGSTGTTQTQNNGVTYPAGVGGAGGAAVVGNSNINWTAVGTRYGAIN